MQAKDALVILVGLMSLGGAWVLILIVLNAGWANFLEAVSKRCFLMAEKSRLATAEQARLIRDGWAAREQ